MWKSEILNNDSGQASKSFWPVNQDFHFKKFLQMTHSSVSRT